MTPTAAGDTAKPAASSSTAAVEFEPPLACVRRILKNSLPSSTNVGKDASSAFARAAGIFVIYITACANDFARENRRQTITANDVLAAVKELDFDEFTPQLTAFLDRHRAAEKSKKDAKAKAKEGAKASTEGTPGDEDEADDAFSPSPKKQKLNKETPFSPDGAILQTDEHMDDEPMDENESMVHEENHPEYESDENATADTAKDEGEKEQETDQMGEE